MIKTILKCVAVGTSVATVVLAILNVIGAKEGLILLGLGLACLSLVSLNSNGIRNKK